MKQEIDHVYFAAERKFIASLPEDKAKTRADLLKTEAIEIKGRFSKFIPAATELLRDTAFTDPSKEFTETEFEKSLDLLAILATDCDGKISPVFWAHPVMSAIYAEVLEESIAGGWGPKLNPWKIKSRLAIHDLGKLLKFRYMLSNQLASRFLAKAGVAENTLDFIPKVENIIGISDSVIRNVKDLPLEFIVADVANNLGQPKLVGGKIEIKTTEEIKPFAKTQPQRYEGGVWINEDVAKRALSERGGQDMAIKLLEEEMEFLSKGFRIFYSDVRNETMERFNLPENQALVKRLLPKP